MRVARLKRILKLDRLRLRGQKVPEDRSTYKGRQHRGRRLQIRLAEPTSLGTPSTIRRVEKGVR